MILAAMPQRHPLPVCPKCKVPMTFNGRTVRFECLKCGGGKRSQG
jgi:tRNA(Ile2) C34 agmatinyltransferase TiaS